LTTHQFQGVPALFRWLSKKYPKISESPTRFVYTPADVWHLAVYSVEEEEEIKVPDEEGNNVTIPVNMSQSNPNGTEFDNLYLDMNGIVSVLHILERKIYSHAIMTGASLYTPRGQGRSNTAHLSLHMSNILPTSRRQRRKKR